MGELRKAFQETANDHRGSLFAAWVTSHHLSVPGAKPHRRNRFRCVDAHSDKLTGALNYPQSKPTQWHPINTLSALLGFTRGFVIIGIYSGG